MVVQYGVYLLQTGFCMLIIFQTLYLLHQLNNPCLTLITRLVCVQGWGKKSLNCRPILIKASTSDEKIKLLCDIELQKVYSNACLRNYDIKYNNLTYEKVHTKYCKFALNVSKCSSSSACMAELGRFPLSFKIWTLCIKYWLRLENGTDNVIVKNAMLCVKNEKHEWLQNIKYILQLNGFGNRWNNPIVSHHAYLDRFALSFLKRL